MSSSKKSLPGYKKNEHSSFLTMIFILEKVLVLAE